MINIYKLITHLPEWKFRHGLGRAQTWRPLGVISKVLYYNCNSFKIHKSEIKKFQKKP